MGIMGALMGLSGCKKPQPQKAQPENYLKLRQMVFSVKPEQLHIDEESGPVWGFVMETKNASGIITLVALADGTVSIYFDNGGGVIGIGQHEKPRRISEELLAFSTRFLPKTSSATAFPHPATGFTRFYFLTFNGVKTAEAKENRLVEGKEFLSPLFHKAHELIASAREIEESRRQ